MAAPKRILAIDFGNSSLKVGCFQVDAVNGLSLLSYRVHDLGIDPSQEEERLGAIQAALSETIHAMGGKDLPVLCSLSGQYAFIRFVKLPPVSADQLDQMIGFEAQQNVPFPIDEVVWDYQLIKAGGDSAEISALLVAVKDDLVEANLSSLREMGIDIVNVDVAPVTLINAFLYNYSMPSDCTLLVDIGARSTNLIFFENGQIFARVVPIGGHMITQSISNEFQEPYKAAEIMKKGKGFVGLGGAYQDPDDVAAARISKLARSTFSRLHAEINRSISFYRNQQGGSAPARILLAGGAASMSYSDLFFKDKFNIEVDYFNPLSRVAVGQEVDRGVLAQEAFGLGEIVGLALRKAGECPAEINLRPASVREATQKKSQMPVLIAALVVLFIAFLCIVGANFFRMTQVNERVASLRGDLARQNSQSAAIKRLNEEMNQLQLSADELVRMTRERNAWHRLLSLMDQATSPLDGLWVTEMSVTHENNSVDLVPAQSNRANRSQGGEQEQPGNLIPEATELNIRGFYETDQGFEIVNRYVQNLEATGLFSSVEILRRDTSDDQIAQFFYIQALFNEANRMDLRP